MSKQNRNAPERGDNTKGKDREKKKEATNTIIAQITYKYNGKPKNGLCQYNDGKHSMESNRIESHKIISVSYLSLIVVVVGIV